MFFQHYKVESLHDVIPWKYLYNKETILLVFIKIFIFREQKNVKEPSKSNNAADQEPTIGRSAS